MKTYEAGLARETRHMTRQEIILKAINKKITLYPIFSQLILAAADR